MFHDLTVHFILFLFCFTFTTVIFTLLYLFIFTVFTLFCLFTFAFFHLVLFYPNPSPVSTSTTSILFMVKCVSCEHSLSILIIQLHTLYRSGSLVAIDLPLRLQNLCNKV